MASSGIRTFSSCSGCDGADGEKNKCRAAGLMGRRVPAAPAAPRAGRLDAACFEAAIARLCPVKRSRGAKVKGSGAQPGIDHREPLETRWYPYGI